MGSSRAKRAQLGVIGEIEKQLCEQAERWGLTRFYTPLRLKEMEEEQGRVVMGEFKEERQNLEYDLYRIGSDKKDINQKIERLEMYTKRGDRRLKQIQEDMFRARERLKGEKAEREKAKKGLFFFGLKSKKESII